MRDWRLFWCCYDCGCLLLLQSSLEVRWSEFKTTVNEVRKYLLFVNVYINMCAQCTYECVYNTYTRYSNNTIEWYFVWFRLSTRQTYKFYSEYEWLLFFILGDINENQWTHRSTLNWSLSLWVHFFVCIFVWMWMNGSK